MFKPFKIFYFLNCHNTEETLVDHLPKEGTLQGGQWTDAGIQSVYLRGAGTMYCAWDLWGLGDVHQTSEAKGSLLENLE